MADIVLIHGSWHWSGCFHRLTPLLTAAGHRVHAVDNASHGADTTAWDTIDRMASYTQNAATALAEANEPVVLLGHSMGGVSVSYLAETMPEKVSKLIYLTAFMTAPGKSAHDHIMAHAENPICAPLWSVLTPVQDFAGLELAADKPSEVKEAFYADCSDEDIALSAANATPINTTVPNLWTPSARAPHPRHYITCTHDRAIPLAAQEEMIAALPGTEVHAMDTSHSPFYSQPAQLAKIINGIA